MSESMKPCHAHRDGKCKFGKKCRYSHVDKPHLHEKTKVCRYFAKGNCDKGEECNFLHPESSAVTAEDGSDVEQEPIDPLDPTLTPQQCFNAFKLFLQPNEDGERVINTVDDVTLQTFLNTVSAFELSPSMASRVRNLTIQLGIDMSNLPQAFQDFLESGKSNREEKDAPAAPRAARKAVHRAAHKAPPAAPRAEHKIQSSVTSSPVGTKGEKHVPARHIQAILDMPITPEMQIGMIKTLISS